MGNIFSYTSGPRDTKCYIERIPDDILVEIFNSPVLWRGKAKSTLYTYLACATVCKKWNALINRIDSVVFLKTVYPFGTGDSEIMNALYLVSLILECKPNQGHVIRNIIGIIAEDSEGNGHYKPIGLELTLHRLEKSQENETSDITDGSDMMRLVLKNVNLLVRGVVTRDEILSTWTLLTDTLLNGYGVIATVDSEPKFHIDFESKYLVNVIRYFYGSSLVSLMVGKPLMVFKKIESQDNKIWQTVKINECNCGHYHVSTGDMKESMSDNWRQILDHFKSKKYISIERGQLKITC